MTTSLASSFFREHPIHPRVRNQLGHLVIVFTGQRPQTGPLLDKNREALDISGANGLALAWLYLASIVVGADIGALYLYGIPL
jgi:hypothetical protein